MWRKRKNKLVPKKKGVLITCYTNKNILLECYKRNAFSQSPIECWKKKWLNVTRVEQQRLFEEHAARMRKHNQSTRDNMCFNNATHLHKEVCKKNQVIQNIKNHNVKRIQDLMGRQPKKKSFSKRHKDAKKVQTITKQSRQWN